MSTILSPINDKIQSFRNNPMIRTLETVAGASNPHLAPLIATSHRVADGLQLATDVFDSGKPPLKIVSERGMQAVQNHVTGKVLDKISPGASALYNTLRTGDPTSLMNMNNLQAVA